MSKEKYLQSKLSAFEDNIKAHSIELGSTSDSLFEHVGVSYLDKQEQYEQRNFESTDRLVKTIYEQRGLRSISSSHNILNFLHQQRNK